LFDLPIPSIKENEIACLSLFQENEKWIFDQKGNRSRSGNSAFFGKELTGKPFGVINKDSLFLNE
jgi:dihydroorotase